MFTRFAAAVLTAGFLATAAQADLGAPRSMTVGYSDLDLGSTEGRAQLHRRVAYAAETVCGAADASSWSSRKSVAACRADAIAAAQPAMVSVFADAGSTLRVAAE